MSTPEIPPGPVVILMDTPNQSAQDYDAIMAAIATGGRLPDGCLAHIAGPGPQGAWRVIAAWRDRATFEAFVTEALTPAREAAGVPAPPAPPVVWSLHNLLMAP